MRRYVYRPGISIPKISLYGTYLLIGLTNAKPKKVSSVRLRLAAETLSDLHRLRECADTYV